MARVRTWKGSPTERRTPDWKPLHDLVGEEVVGDFMWMFEVKLSDGSLLQAYKHRDTRRYLHLNSDGVAFAYHPPDRYRSIDAADVLCQVFASLPELAFITDSRSRLHGGSSSRRAGRRTARAASRSKRAPSAW